MQDAIEELVASAETMDTGADSTVWGSDMSGASWSQGTVNLYPSGAPSPNDVNQKGIGSCAVDAALAGWAAQNPGEIQSHITPIGEGGKDGYAVAMVSPDGKPISVEVDNDIFKDASGNTLNVSSANGDGNWATVMEKALAKYKDIYGADPIGGERSDDAIYAFRGDKGSVGFEGGQTTVADAQAMTAPENRAVVTGGFNEEFTLPSGKKKHSPGMLTRWWA